MVDYDKVNRLLMAIQPTLQQLELWVNDPPTDEALSSQEPFCVDMMTATEWLQWVFLPKMMYLVDNNLPLPTRFAIAPYLEEALSEQHFPLVDLLREIDSLLNRED